METKSRYEVISDLESKKRELIKEKDGLNDKLIERQKHLKLIERQKSDNNMVLDRQIEDIKEDIKIFEQTMKERKETIGELIKSVDDSLNRFNTMGKKE